MIVLPTTPLKLLVKLVVARLTLTTVDRKPSIMSLKLTVASPEWHLPLRLNVRRQRLIQLLTHRVILLRLLLVVRPTPVHNVVLLPSIPHTRLVASP